MDRGAWWAAVHGVAKSRTRLNDFTFHFHALEKEMAIHSSVLAWRVPGMGEPHGLPSMGSCRVGHDWSDLAAAAAEKTESGCKEELQNSRLGFRTDRFIYYFDYGDTLRIINKVEMYYITFFKYVWLILYHWHFNKAV